MVESVRVSSNYVLVAIVISYDWRNIAIPAGPSETRPTRSVVQVEVRYYVIQSPTKCGTGRRRRVPFLSFQVSSSINQR